ncbi:MAG: hypothetical protein M1602_05050 [Firmicutes bacterium]|nr:hypothetical protein [Bacillota bacterium]
MQEHEDKLPPELNKARPGAPQDYEDDLENDRPIELGWMDVFAFIIAAFQILFPILFLFFGVLIVVYFIFRLLFH